MQLPGGHNKLNSINSMRPGEEMEMPECNQGNQVLPIFGEDNSWLMILYVNLPPFVSNVHEYDTEYTCHKSQVISCKS